MSLTMRYTTLAVALRLHVPFGDVAPEGVEIEPKSLKVEVSVQRLHLLRYVSIEWVQSCMHTNTGQRGRRTYGHDRIGIGWIRCPHRSSRNFDGPRIEVDGCPLGLRTCWEGSNGLEASILVTRF